MWLLPVRTGYSDRMTTTIIHPRDITDHDDADTTDHTLIADVHQVLTTAARLCDQPNTPHTTAKDAVIAAVLDTIGTPERYAGIVYDRAIAALDAVPAYHHHLELTPAAAAIRAADHLAAAHPYVSHR